MASYHYGSSTLFSDHYLPLLVVATHPVARDDKPHPDATARTAEHHMPWAALSPEEEADYRRAVAARRLPPPEEVPEVWPRRLQQAMYD